MLPFDEETGTRYKSRNHQKNWISILLVVIGIFTGRYLLPYYTAPVFPEFTTWARSAPSLNTRAQRAALEGNDHLPESVATNLRLTHEECNVGFPLLWKEVNETRNAVQKKGGVTLRDVENAEQGDGTRVAIIDGRIYVKRWHPESTTRSQAILHSLYAAVVSAPEPIPDVEFWFRATDNLIYGSHFGLNREAGKMLWLLPDFGFWSWPEPGVKGWNDFRIKAFKIDSQLSWNQKIGKLFWRGAFLSEFRRTLRDMVKNYIWSDIGEIDWAKNAEGRIEMVDHCRYKYLASIEGNSAYSGRLKHLLMCRSVTVSHKMNWIQHFHSAFNSDPDSPDQNIVEMKTPNSWTELPHIMDELIADPPRAQRIADNAIRTMRGRYLTPASIHCYWRRVLAEYASLQQFTPTIDDGTDFESMILMSKVHWAPS